MIPFTRRSLQVVLPPQRDSPRRALVEKLSRLNFTAKRRTGIGEVEVGEVGEDRMAESGEDMSGYDVRVANMEIEVDDGWRERKAAREEI